MVQRKRHNYIRDKKKYLRELETVKNESLVRDSKRIIEYEKKYGKQIHHEKINEGKEDRLLGKSPRIYEDESMQRAYEHGYYENGSVALEGAFLKGVFSEEKQMEFGMFDLINNVSSEYLKNLIKYPAYAYGRNYQMGKKTYDFINKEGITFEEYVFSMELLFPEVTTEAFKLGYEAKKQEETNSLFEQQKKHR